jgi:cell division protein FtsB
MNTQTPYEQIRFINDAIKDRLEKNQATFFSVEVERFGALTPLVTKEAGTNFYETIIQYLTKYDLSALIVKLYNGKSHNVKDPFQTFKILVKRNAELTGFGINKEEDLKVSPSEAVITTEKHFFTLAEKERQVMMLEFDLKRLQYENEELKRKNKKKKNYIEELENELGKSEKSKKNSLGNVTLGLAGANALESFAKSSFGIGILKNVFGIKDEVLSGLLGTEENANSKNDEVKSTASLISSAPIKQEPDKTQTIANQTQTSSSVNPAANPTSSNQVLSKEEKIRLEIKKYILNFLDTSNDSVLRLYYELVQYIGSDVETLQSIVGQVKTYREKQKAIIDEDLKKQNATKAKGIGNDEGKDTDSEDLHDSS